MTEDERRAYAIHLIENHAQDVEYLSIFEMYAAYVEDDDADISDDDAKAVSVLVTKATVAASFPDAVPAGGAS